MKALHIYIGNVNKKGLFINFGGDVKKLEFFGF